jgi:hypothetical protein
LYPKYTATPKTKKRINMRGHFAEAVLFLFFTGMNESDNFWAMLQVNEKLQRLQEFIQQNEKKWHNELCPA